MVFLYQPDASKTTKNSQHFWRKEKKNALFSPFRYVPVLFPTTHGVKGFFFPVNADPTTREAIRLDFFQAEAFLMRAKVRSRQKAQEDLKARLLRWASVSRWVFSLLKEGKERKNPMGFLLEIVELSEF